MSSRDLGAGKGKNIRPRGGSSEQLAYLGDNDRFTGQSPLPSETPEAMVWGPQPRRAEGGAHSCISCFELTSTKKGNTTIPAFLCVQ